MVDEFPTLIVEAGFGGPSFGTSLILDDATRGIIGTGTLYSGAVDIPFIDISEFVHRVVITRGSRRVNTPILKYEAGTCSIELDNSDRRFDPTNLDGPYVTGGLTDLLPMRAIRIRAEYDDGSGTVTYDLFRGFADSWQVTYSEPSYSRCTLTATDGFKVLSKVDRAAVSPVGGGEDTGARISRVLDSADWPTVDRVIGVGDSTLQETDLAGNALTEIQLDSDSELGDFFIDAAGRAVFLNRHATWSTSSVTTFDDSSSDYTFMDAPIDYGDTNIFNDVRITNEGGTVQEAVDGTSQLTYLRRSFSRTGLLLETDADAESYAQAIVFIAGAAELRFESLLLNPRRAPETLFPEVLGRDFGDRITVVRHPPGGGDPIEREVFIRGVEHEMKPKQWRTKWALQSASKYNFFELDDAVQGTFGNNALGF